MVEIARKPRAARTVSLTSLIDVVFLLIIFFMLSTSFVMSESMELNLPSDAVATTVSASEVAEIWVRPEGTVRLNGTDYDAKAFDEAITGMLRADPEQKILVLSMQDVTVQQLVSVLDLLYLNGARNVQIDNMKAES